MNRADMSKLLSNHVSVGRHSTIWPSLSAGPDYTTTCNSGEADSVDTCGLEEKIHINVQVNATTDNMYISAFTFLL